MAKYMDRRLQNKRLHTKPYDILCPMLRTVDNEPLLDRIIETQASFPHEDGVTCVSSQSPGSHKRAVEILAHYFRREFRYDFLQYNAKEHTDDNETLAFMWSVGFFPDVAVIGACCFRWREWEDLDPSWAMQWIWLHPYFRRKQLLTRSWPAFCRLFKSFDVEPPISPAMADFLKDKPHVLRESAGHQVPFYVPFPPGSCLNYKESTHDERG